MAKKTDEERFAELKRAALEQVMPYFLNPFAYPMPKLTLDECAVLTAPSAAETPSRVTMCKTEKSALGKMKAGLARFGITRVDDVLGPPR